MRLNWAAILLAGVVDWLLGAVWFTVFARAWTAGLRMSPEEVQAYKAHPNFWPYIIAFLCSILMAMVIARLIAASATQGLVRGVAVGILVGLAAAVAMVTEMIFEVRAGGFVLIAAGYPLIGCILMGIILGAWKGKARDELGRTAQA